MNRPSPVALVVFSVLFVAGLIGSLFSVALLANASERTVPVSGVVTNRPESCTVKYEVDGVSYTGKGPTSKRTGTYVCTAKAGETVTVYYDPADPGKSSPTDPSGNRAGGIVAAVMGVILLAVSSLGLASFFRRLFRWMRAR